MFAFYECVCVTMCSRLRGIASERNIERARARAFHMSDNLKIPRIQNPSNCDKLDVRKVSFNLFFIHVVFIIHSCCCCCWTVFLLSPLMSVLWSAIEPLSVIYSPNSNHNTTHADGHMKWYRQHNSHDDETYYRCNWSDFFFALLNIICDAVCVCSLLRSSYVFGCWLMKCARFAIVPTIPLSFREVRRFFILISLSLITKLWKQHVRSPCIDIHNFWMYFLWAFLEPPFDFHYMEIKIRGNECFRGQQT